MNAGLTRHTRACEAAERAVEMMLVGTGEDLREALAQLPAADLAAWLADLLIRSPDCAVANSVAARLEDELLAPGARAARDTIAEISDRQHRARCETAYEILCDLVDMQCEKWSIGGGPRWREREEAIWARARELFAP